MKRYSGVIPAFLAFAACWHLLSLFVGRPLLPAPAEVFRALFSLAAEGRLWRHLGTSFSRILWSLAASGLPAVILGIAAGRSRRLDRLISPVIYLLHPLPKAAFLPVILLFFGIGELSKIFLIAFIVFSQILVTMRDAAKQVSGFYIDSVRSLGAGKPALLRHVILPAVLPAFFSAFRVSLGTAAAVLFFAETFASESGLGFLIADAWTRIAYAEMYAAILALSVLTLVLFFSIDLLEYFLCPWLKDA